jgi:hypothetical protein
LSNCFRILTLFQNCGNVVCGACSENRKFLESSRSGAPKRICDRCFASERGYGEDGSENEDEEVSDARKRVDKMSASDDDGEGKRGAKVSDASIAESVEAIKANPFEGQWVATLIFSSVEMGKSAAGEAIAAGATVGAFKPTAKVGSTSKETKSVSDLVVRTGSKFKLKLALEMKGAAYFKGDVPEFAQFGKEGKVTGAIQRTLGKVNMTVQMVKDKVTTSFNFVGMMNSAGVLSGSFSGCEISKAAGSCNGSFTMSKVISEEEEVEVEEEPVEEVKPKKKKPAKKVAESDDEQEEEEEDEVKPKKKKSAEKKTKKKVESDSD